MIRGIERVPRKGPVLVVGNHTGGVTSPEITISQLAFSAYFGVERPHYQLAHRMVLNSPIGWMLRRFGTVEADPAERRAGARRRRDGDGVPGGDYEVFRPSWESAKVDFGGRKGFLRLALSKDVPIVPMVTIGGQETALFLVARRAARPTHRRRPRDAPEDAAGRVRPAIRPQLGGFPPFLPLPAKVTIELLEPIDLRARYGADPDIDEVYEDLMATMQEALTRTAGRAAPAGDRMRIEEQVVIGAGGPRGLDAGRRTAVGTASSRRA